MDLIGRNYLPYDNSYAMCISNETKGKQYLAGTMHSDAKVCKVVSEPYEIINYNGAKITMINVEYDGDINMVMFREDNVLANTFGLSKFIPKEVYATTINNCIGWRHTNEHEEDWLQDDGWLSKVQDITKVSKDHMLVVFNTVVDDEGIYYYSQSLYKI